VGSRLTGRPRRAVSFLALTTAGGIACRRWLRVNVSAPDLVLHDAELLCS